jgi:hypothetical protein
LRLLGGGYVDTVQVYASNSGASTEPASALLLALGAAGLLLRRRAER